MPAQAGVSKPPFFMHMRKYLFFLFFLFVLFSSCTTLRQRDFEDVSYLPETFDWQEVAPGVETFDFKNPEIPLIYHAVKIELTSPRDGAPDLELLSSLHERTSDFAAREKCLVAVNATPFDKAGNLVGIHKEEGKIISHSNSRYAAIAFGQDGAVIFESQADEKFEAFDYAFGGFWLVLKDGEVCTDFVRRTDSRSGAGLSADGKTLYLLVVEGERPSHSIGLSFPQCGEIFRAMGCSDALEFDGGGSSELCINGKSVLSYKVKRVHGNCFGFKLR